MKLAFCLFKYFPYGGLQRDCLRIAEACYEQGHTIHFYTSDWQGPLPSFGEVTLLKLSGWQNHTRNQSFFQALKKHRVFNQYDCVIGFNKMPLLDIYFAADVCYQARIHEQRHFFYQLLPRYRQQLSFEKAVFAKGALTEILLIAEKQQKEFIHYYQTETSRFHLLPPGISKQCFLPDKAHEIRKNLRSQFNIANDEFILLMVGSGFATKGVDRSLRALQALPRALANKSQLWVVGQGDEKPFMKLAKQLKVVDKLHFFGGRTDVPHFLLSADLLLHPAYHENTGTVLLEAAIAGLPVLTLDHCGYAHYIRQAKSGCVLPSPFSQRLFNQTLAFMLSSSLSAQWKQNGLHFAKEADIYDLPQHAAQLIEKIGRRKKHVMAK